MPRLLLDTHIILWWIGDAEQFGAATKIAISDPGTEIFYSAISEWEISVKEAKGKLKIDWREFDRLIKTNQFHSLAVTPNHGRVAGALPPVHGDPFDRMLVAQAQVEGLTLVTADRILEKYDVEILRA